MKKQALRLKSGFFEPVSSRDYNKSGVCSRVHASASFLLIIPSPVSALWYWGSTMAGRDPKTYITPVYIIYAVWPLSVMSIIFSYLMFFGLPEYYRQVSGND